jgi:tRNA (cytidine/uridine-2'-O-)-methyltransferase
MQSWMTADVKFNETLSPRHLLRCCAMLHVVLFQPEIPHNTGAVGRLCLATGARLHLIKPLGFSLDDKYVKRSGLDYWQEVDVRIWDSLEALKAEAGSAAHFFFLTTKTTRCYWDARFPDESYLIFGPETRGLPESLLAEAEPTCLRIPMRGETTRSLNLATAVGIVLYEAVRQQGTI